MVCFVPVGLMIGHPAPSPRATKKVHSPRIDTTAQPPRGHRPSCVRLPHARVRNDEKKSTRFITRQHGTSTARSPVALSLPTISLLRAGASSPILRGIG